MGKNSRESCAIVFVMFALASGNWLVAPCQCVEPVSLSLNRRLKKAPFEDGPVQEKPERLGNVQLNDSPINHTIVQLSEVNCFVSMNYITHLANPYQEFFQIMAQNQQSSQISDLILP